MKTIFLTSFFALLLKNLGYTQINLVPNFSFEEYTNCPDEQDQIEYATGWSKYSTSSSTPDYYNSCSSSNLYGVPYSNSIYQPERRECNAYSGLVTWGSSGNDREYIGIQLNESLVIGQKYFISFYTVMGELKIGNDYFGMPSNNIGIRLSLNNYDTGNPSPIDNTAHLYSSEIINDSINWIRISGSIVADQSYGYLTIGNFFDDNNTDTLHYNCTNCINYGSYYLIDDICVSTDSTLCNGGIDILGCNAKINEFDNQNILNIYPNPVIDILNIAVNQNIKIELYDLLGKLIYFELVKNNISKINMKMYEPSYYTLKVLNENDELISHKKIIKL